MLSILIDEGVDGAVVNPLFEAFAGLGLTATSWRIDAPTPIGTVDAVITCPDRLVNILERLARSTGPSRVVLLANSPDATETRALLRLGAAAVIDISGTEPLAQALVALGAATGVCVSLPSEHGVLLASKLAEPPRDLEPEEVRLLALAATRSIESAGTAMGLSRRQTQRRFKRLCKDLSLASHLHAAVAAASWGIVDVADVSRVA